jgi:16S rRNA (cytidine1402-2'-O)-methyltransferase
MLPIESGMNLGIISEAGCPGIADPGAVAVKYAHEKGYQVVPLIGPSSITLALMASGLNGQRFCFQGYLPIDAKEAAAAVRGLEKESKLRNQTQIFIETPYRNNAIFQILLKNLASGTLLTIAQDITGEAEFIHTKPVSKWVKEELNLPKIPAVFLFLA